MEELRGKTDLPVEVVGIQFYNHSYYSIRNSGMYSGRRAPWVLETAAVQPFRDWRLPVAGHSSIVWRDAVIVDENGEYVAFQSLTDNSLALAANATVLRNVLSSNATITSTDADALPDKWELSQLGSVNFSPTADPASAGRSLLLSYAMGLPAKFSADQGPIISQVAVAGKMYYQMSYRRRLGLEGVSSSFGTARITYQPQILTPASATWSNTGWTPVSTVDPWDGTGTQIVTVRSSVPTKGVGAPSRQLVRLRVAADD